MGPSVIVISLGLIRHDQDVAKPSQEEQLQVRSEVTVTYNKFFANVCNSIFIIFIQYPPVRPLHSASAQPQRRCGKEFCYPELAPGRGELHHEEVRVSRDEGDCRQSSLAG